MTGKRYVVTDDYGRQTDHANAQDARHKLDEQVNGRAEVRDPSGQILTTWEKR